MLRPVRIRLYLQLMQQRGFAAPEVLAGTGIAAAQLSDPGYRVDPKQSQRVILNMLDLSGDGGIGFDGGVRTEASDLGIIGYAILSCATMRQTLSLWGQYSQTLVGILSCLEVTETSQGAMITVVAPRKADPLFGFCAEEVLAMMFKLSGMLARGAAVMRLLRLSYSAPKHS